MYNPDFAQILKFSQEDLEYNRQGFLSPTQVAGLKKSAVIAISVLGSLGAFFWFMVVYFQLSPITQNNMYLGAGLFLLFFGIGAYLYHQSNQDALDGTVQIITQAPTRILTVKNNSTLHVGELKFRILPQLKSYLLQKPYTFYYTTKGHQLVAIEDVE